MLHISPPRDDLFEFIIFPHSHRPLDALPRRSFICRSDGIVWCRWRFRFLKCLFDWCDVLYMLEHFIFKGNDDLFLILYNSYLKELNPDVFFQCIRKWIVDSIKRSQNILILSFKYHSKYNCVRLMNEFHLTYFLER